MKMPHGRFVPSFMCGPTLLVAAAAIVLTTPALPQTPTFDLPSLKVESVFIALGPRGFEPAEVNRTAARLLVIIHRQNRPTPIATRLQLQEGPLLRDVTIVRKGNDWMELHDFRPGEYVLTDIANPVAVCRIRVKAN